MEHLGHSVDASNQSILLYILRALTLDMRLLVLPFKQVLKSSQHVQISKGIIQITQPSEI